MNDFRSELKDLINSKSMENGSNTPDFILAKYLSNCLAAFDEAVTSRSLWYGHVDAPGVSVDCPPEPSPKIPETPVALPYPEFSIRMFAYKSGNKAVAEPSRQVSAEIVLDEEDVSFGALHNRLMEAVGDFSDKLKNQVERAAVDREELEK